MSTRRTKPLAVAAAATRGQAGVAQLLLNHQRIELNSMDHHWNSLYMLSLNVDVSLETRIAALAAANRHRSASPAKGRSNVEVNVRDLSGLTPLNLATKEGHVYVVRVLFEHDDV